MHNINDQTLTIEIGQLVNRIITVAMLEITFNRLGIVRRAQLDYVSRKRVVTFEKVGGTEFVLVSYISG